MCHCITFVWYLLPRYPQMIFDTRHSIFHHIKFVNEATQKGTHTRTRLVSDVCSGLWWESSRACLTGTVYAMSDAGPCCWTLVLTVDAPTLFFFSSGCNKKAIPSLEGNELFEQECKPTSHWLTLVRSSNQRRRFNVCYWSNMGALSADIGDVVSWRPSQQSDIMADNRTVLMKTFWRYEKRFCYLTIKNQI